MKQNSIDWLVEQLTEVDYGCINKTFLQINNSLAGHKLRELFEQAKAMHKEEIVKAYNRDVINKKQNWAIENGERYYNLHYKGDQVGISGKEEQVGESSRENQLGKTNPDYKFEDGV